MNYSTKKLQWILKNTSFESIHLHSHFHQFLSNLFLMVNSFSSCWMLSKGHLRFTRQQGPHLVFSQLGHGKWQPGQVLSRQSQMSNPFARYRPLPSNIVVGKRCPCWLSTRLRNFRCSPTGFGSDNFVSVVDWQMRRRSFRWRRSWAIQNTVSGKQTQGN